MKYYCFRITAEIKARDLDSALKKLDEMIHEKKDAKVLKVDTITTGVRK